MQVPFKPHFLQLDCVTTDDFSLDNEARPSSYDRVSQRGIFITFEGLDGCGKSTQIKELRHRLRGLGDRIVLTREPGGTMLGEEIRKILQDNSGGSHISARAELLLFTASRTQLVTEVVEPALSQGKHVIADRFLDSTTIYQGVARGLDRHTVEAINRFAVGSCLPDITFLMDITPSDARRRLSARGGQDRIETMPESFFHDLRTGYLELAQAEPGRFVVVDAMQKIGVISRSIWQTITQKFSGFLG